jgi:hypothetical protein
MSSFLCMLCDNALYECKSCKTKICMEAECQSVYENRITLTKLYSKDHDKCLECDKKITCNSIGVCCECMNSYPYYHFIIDRIAIGDARTSYAPFDIVLNLNFPYNRVKLGEIQVIKHSDKIFINCGIEDDDDEKREEEMRDIFFRLLHTLENELKDISHLPTILFHCYAGISRSATIAILFLSKFLNIDPSNVYEIAKMKRKCILPNKLFKKILKI